MTWHWSYKTLPELAGLPDAEKERVWRLASRRARWRPGLWLARAACFGPALVLLVLARARRRGFQDFTATMALVAFGTVAGRIVFDYASILLTRPFLLRELPGRCRGCGYDLTDNASGACPECGRAA